MRISAILPGDINIPRAIHIYRITQPLSFIDEATSHEVSWTTSDFLLKSDESAMDYILGSDIIIFGRHVVREWKIARELCDICRSKGAKLVYETDDDLTNAYRDVSDGDGANCIPFLSLVDAITVTTSYLAGTLSHFTEKPIYVLPNKVDHTFFKRRLKGYNRKYSGTFNIMLTGTATHGDDWIVASKAMKQILNDHADTRLLVGGFTPDYIEYDDNVEKLPFLHYKDYPTMLVEADIVVAAIDPDDKFNHSKSAVKAMEAWAATRQLENGSVGGAAVVATDSVVYDSVVNDGVNGLLVEHTVDGYLNAIESLITDSRLRMGLQRKGYRELIKNHSIHRGWRKWLTVYHKVKRGIQ